MLQFWPSDAVSVSHAEDEAFGQPHDPAGGTPAGRRPFESAPQTPIGNEIELDVEPLPSHEELLQLREERDAYLDQLQRERAEFANFRRRTERERVTQRAAVIRDVVLQVLPVLDNLERAVSALTQKDPMLAGGVDMVRAQLAQVLAGHGLSEVEAAGQQFDPNVHDAIASVPSAQHAEGVVVEVVEKGYRTDADLVRAAKVVVATAPPAASAN
jgi:molecular chaperone GrpE